MTLSKEQLGWLGVGVLWAVVSTLPAVADDTEIFVGTSGAGVQPNILFIIDDSGSMAGEVLSQEDYNPATVYPSQGCATNRVYWRSGSGAAPACSTDRWFYLSALKCDAALQAFNTAGFFTATMAAQYDPTNSGSGKRWEALTNSHPTVDNRIVECYDDRGVHGNGVDAANLYARNGAVQVSPGTGYWGTAGQEITWGASPTSNLPHTLYSGNYLNYLNAPPVLRTRMSIVQDVVTDLLDTVNGVNVGLVDFNLFNDNVLGSEGGHVAHAIENIAAARAPMQAQVDALVATNSPATSTPLAETLYEVAQYYMGNRVVFGANGGPGTSSDGTGNAYDSPIEYECQKNFVVYLTDGEPTWDNSADARVLTMQDAAGASL